MHAKQTLQEEMMKDSPVIDELGLSQTAVPETNHRNHQQPNNSNIAKNEVQEK